WDINFYNSPFLLCNHDFINIIAQTILSAFIFASFVSHSRSLKDCSSSFKNAASLEVSLSASYRQHLSASYR
ncbi:MAG: hypothetical protein LBV04_00020, partial [Deferribacteraceae bacterium]|nr:hypothetical protein [Deferribacteraceae bacterium]